MTVLVIVLGYIIHAPGVVMQILRLWFETLGIFHVCF